MRKLKKLDIKFRKDLLNKIEETFGFGYVSWFTNYIIEKALKGDKDELRKELYEYIDRERNREFNKNRDLYKNQK
jgi:hypothetical protein